ncbi:hypothetical protein TNCV_3676031 [Trichonephila clavipes]|nr:hypothetical protein TNCV_3676031 [Trichonephila clavipes]
MEDTYHSGYLNTLPKREYSHQVPNERSPLRCYGCGKEGSGIKSRCHLRISTPHKEQTIATIPISATRLRPEALD